MEELGLHQDVLFQLKRLGAKVFNNPSPVPENFEITILENDQKIKIPVFLPQKFRDLFKVDLSLSWGDGLDEEFYVIFDVDDVTVHPEYQSGHIDFSMPSGMDDPCETMDALPFPVACCLSDEANAVLSFYDLRDEKGMEEGNPTVVRIDHETWYDDDNMSYKLSEFLAEITIFDSRGNVLK